MDVFQLRTWPAGCCGIDRGRDFKFNCTVICGRMKFAVYRLTLYTFIYNILNYNVKYQYGNI
jgi:hypothetical protein